MYEQLTFFRAEGLDERIRFRFGQSVLRVGLYGQMFTNLSGMLDPLGMSFGSHMG